MNRDNLQTALDAIRENNEAIVRCCRAVGEYAAADAWGLVRGQLRLIDVYAQAILHHQQAAALAATEQPERPTPCLL